MRDALSQAVADNRAPACAGNSQCEELRCLVLPRMRGNVVKLGSSLTQAERVSAMLAVASALRAVHAAGLIHRDVKAANVLLDDEHRVYLADCGLTQTADASIGATAGEAGYVDPAVFIHKTEALSTAVDVYGLGIFIAEQLTGLSASTRETLADDFLKALKREDFHDRFMAMVWRDLEVFDKLAVLATRCLAPTGPSRPTAAQVASALEEVQRSHISARLNPAGSASSPLAYEAGGA